MHPARLVLRALQVSLELQAPLELLEPQVRVRRGQQGPQARLELRGPQGLLVQLGLQVLLERRVLLELQVLLARRLQVRQE